MIVFRDVYKSFGPKKVLEGFSLDVQEGETMVLIGGSGTGKSVVLKHIVGLLEPDAGEVEVDGQVVHQLDRKALMALRATIGFVFQFAALFDSMTVADNVGMGLRRIEEFSAEDIRARVSECLAMVDLDGYENRFPSELSGGQRKRAGLARAIATKPKYLLYDEPTTGLDPVTTAVIGDLILKMSDELGVTGVVITHDMQSAFRISDRVAMLYDGRVRFEGTPDEFRATEDPVVKGFIEGRPELLEAAS